MQIETDRDACHSHRIMPCVVAVVRKMPLRSFRNSDRFRFRYRVDFVHSRLQQIQALSQCASAFNWRSK